MIILAVIVLILVLYLFMIYKPKSAEIAKFKQDLTAVKKEKEEKEKIVADLDEFNREVKELEQRLNEALSQLPNEREVDKILAQLSRLITDSGLMLQKFVVQPEMPKTLYNEVPISLEISGNFHNIALFFDKASKLKRIINFSGMTLAEPKNERGDTLITVTCTATTFRFNKAASKAPPAKPKRK